MIVIALKSIRIVYIIRLVYYGSYWKCCYLSQALLLLCIAIGAFIQPIYKKWCICCCCNANGFACNVCVCVVFCCCCLHLDFIPWTWSADTICMPVTRSKLNGITRIFVSKWKTCIFCNDNDGAFLKSIGSRDLCLWSASIEPFRMTLCAIVDGNATTLIYEFIWLNQIHVYRLKIDKNRPFLFCERYFTGHYTGDDVLKFFGFNFNRRQYVSTTTVAEEATALLKSQFQLEGFSDVEMYTAK